MSKRNTKLAGRYASALLKAVVDSKEDAAEVATELAAIAELWESNSQLSSSLQNPLFSKQERMQSLKIIMESLGLSGVVQRFVTIVFERDRIKALAELSEIFSQRVEKAAGIIRVSVKVARELSTEEKSEIESSLAAQLQGQAEYDWLVDPEILGGLVVEYEGHILDGSVSGRLDRLERELLG